MNIYCIYDQTPKSLEVLELIIKDYKNSIILSDPPFDKKCIVLVLGGDGFMLRVLHKYMECSHKFFGLNTGSVGFLMNLPFVENLIDRINKAEEVNLNPLEMEAHSNGKAFKALAINEVSLFREQHQASHLRISINNKIKIEEMVADGLLVATPAGSSAYNYSAGGSIIPLGSNILSMTPLNPYKPRRWNGALLPSNSNITIEVLDSEKRPVSVTADFNEFRDVSFVSIFENKNININLLFDPEHSLEDRIINEQFK